MYFFSASLSNSVDIVTKHVTSSIHYDHVETAKIGQGQIACAILRIMAQYIGVTIIQVNNNGRINGLISTIYFPPPLQ